MRTTIKKGCIMGEVKRALFKDAIEIYNLIKKYPVEVVPRSLSDIATNIDRFFVYKDKRRMLGAISWRILPEMGKETEHIIEIISLCVSKRHHKKGIGRLLTQAVIAHVQKFNPTRIVLLTFSPRFFGKMGFRKISKRKLQNKLYLGCINCTKYTNPLTCPEVAMELKV
jgi:amino-acid N-acetyltransferase